MFGLPVSKCDDCAVHSKGEPTKIYIILNINSDSLVDNDDGTSGHKLNTTMPTSRSLKHMQLLFDSDQPHWLLR